MLSNKLTFSLASLVVLLVAALCFTNAAQAAKTLTIPAGPVAKDGFVVYSRAAAPTDAAANAALGFAPTGVTYLQITGDPAADTDFPDLEEFFSFDWMIEIIAPADLRLDPKDLVISEIMWGLDEGVAAAEQAGKQWIELYNTSGAAISINADAATTNDDIFILLTHFPKTLPTNYLMVPHIDTDPGTPALDGGDVFTGSEVLAGATAYKDGKYTNRLNAADPNKGKAITKDDPHNYVVLDRVSNLEWDDNLQFRSRWTLPGQSGRSALETDADQRSFPEKELISANRKINYAAVKKADGVPDGHKADSWEATDTFARRNTVNSLFVANPGMGLDPSTFVAGAATAAPGADKLVINEVRNSNNDDLDWIEVKNVMDPTAEDPEIQLEKWELNIYTGGINADNGNPKDEKELVDFPKYELGPQEILLIVNRDPSETELAGGVNLDVLIDADRDQLNKGAQHLYIVRDTLVLPNSGDFLLLLRSADDKNNGPDAIEDAAGSLEKVAYANDRTARTEVAPFKNYATLGDDKVGGFGGVDNNHSAWARKPKGVKAGYYIVDNANGRHKGAWDKVTGADTHGIGYDREVDLDFAPGTPGYENMIANTIDDYDDTDPDPDGMEIAADLISISEVMYDAGPRWNLIQWIELYNASMTQSVNLKGWQLEIRNATDEVESYVDSSFIFEDAVILPNQTLLLVSGSGANDVPGNRVYNLFEKHRRELGLTTRRSVLLSPTGFFLKLVDKADIDRDDRSDQDELADEVGNVMVDGASRIVEWELPARGDVRQSLVRQYGTSKLDGSSDPASDGTMSDSWKQSDIVGAGLSYFGHRDDVGTPGYRLGGPLPVSLSSFRPVRDKATGEVVITWVTESELNNAGFNILRREGKEGEFKVINLQGIIAGHGTTSEKHVYTYTDKATKPNVVYYYQIEDVSLDGKRTPLMTTHLRGNVNAAGKLTTTWSNLKLQK